MKKIIKVVIVCVVLAVLLYLLVSLQVKQEISSGISTPDFMMELSGVRLRGWNKQVLAWEMKSANAYYYDKNTLVLTGVNEGYFLDSTGKNLIDEFLVSTVNANIINKEFVLNNVRLKLHSDISSNVFLAAERFSYLDGSLYTDMPYILQVNDWQVTSGKMTYNLKEDKMEFADNLRINKGKSSLRSNHGVYSPVSNSVVLSGEVEVSHNILHKGKEYLLNIFSDSVDILLLKDEPDLTFNDGMIFRFGEDVLYASYGNYNPDKKILKMTDTVIRIDDGSEILANIKAEDIKGSIIKGHKVDVLFDEKKIILSEIVTYERGTRKIVANSGVYDVNAGLLYLRGGVAINEGTKSIYSDEVTVDVKKDVILAKGKVKTKISI